MRKMLLTVTCLLLAVSAAPAQDRDEDKPLPPLRKGERIVAKGCLRGSMLQGADAGHAKDDLRPTGLSFQLKGKKGIVKDLKKKYDGHFVQVTGILRSNVDDDYTRGRRVGPARIIVGAESTTRGGTAMMNDMNQPQPVLDITEYEGTELSCRH